MYSLLLKATVLGADDPIAELRKYLVVEVLHLKAMPHISHSQHESVCVEIRAPGETHTRFLRFERTLPHRTTLEDLKGLGDLKMEELKVEVVAADSEGPWFQRFASQICDAFIGPKNMSLCVDSASLASTASFASSSDSSPGATTADDIVTYAEDLPSDAIISRYTIPEHSLSLLQLSLMAVSVRLQDPMYTLFKHQCFWFSVLLVALVSREPGCVRDENVGAIASAEIEQDEVCLHKVPKEQQHCPNLGGRWQRIKVTRLKEVMVTKIRSHYDAEWRKVQETVSGGHYYYR